MIAVILAALACGPMWSPLAQAPSPPSVISEIRVQGNATITDETVVELAGVSVGTPLTPDTIAQVTKRLRDSGRFDVVDVRKRYRTLEMDQVALLIIVHEHPGTSPSGQPPSTLHRLKNHLMYFPILSYEEGYGWTYGVQTSVVGVLGRRERLSVPLSWGATRRAALDVEKPFTNGPLSRVEGSFGISQTENPFFLADDRRTAFDVRAERRLFSRITLGADTGRDQVRFAPEDQLAAPVVRDGFWTTGADATFDTRIDPAFPVDAVLASVRVERLGAGRRAQAVDRTKFSVAGYKRVFREIVFAAHTEYDSASGPLPAYEEWLLGGSSLRGTRAGTFAGDKRLLWGGEFRVPFSSPLSDLGRTGFNVFLDGGSVAPFGQSIGHAATERGAGAGVFIIATVVRLNFEVAHSLDHRGTGFRFGMGFTF